MKCIKIGIGVITLLHLVLVSYAGGIWTLYPSAQNIYDIAFERKYIWCATNGGVIRWNKKDGTHKIITTNDGLADNLVISVFVDRDGVKWFGTKKGITKYDGTTFTTFTTQDGLVYDYVIAIAQDRNGIMWFGTENGVSKFDGTLWTSYTTENGLVSNYIKAIKVDNNNVIWIGSSGGISCFDGITWRIYAKKDIFADGHITDLAVGPDGKIWVSTTFGGGFSCYDGVSWKNFNILEHILSLDFDEDGLLWLGAAGKICSFDGSLLTCFSEGLQYEYTDSFIVAVDSDGTKWIGSKSPHGNRLGLSSFDGKSWKHHAINSVINNSVNAVAVDHDDVKWFGTYCGISSFDGVTWKSYTAENEIETNRLLPFTVYGADVDRNNIKWFATRYGVKSFDGYTWKNYVENDSLSLNKFHTVVIDHDNVKWFASAEGVCSFDGTEWERYTVEDGLICNSVNTIAVDNYNGLWFGTDYGVSYYNRIDWMTFTEETGMHSTKVISIAVDQNNVMWLGGETVMSFGGITWKEHQFELEPLRKLCGGVKITVDKKNVVWVAMSGTCTGGGSIPGGLASYDGTTWTTYEDNFQGRPFMAFGSDVDEKNIKWFATGYGVMSYDDKPENVVEKTDKVPEALIILGNYPNPFNPSTTIDFTLPVSSFTDLVIYNISGQKVRELISDTMSAGTHSIIWNGCDNNGIPVSSGVYISQLKTGKFTSAHKMMLNK